MNKNQNRKLNVSVNSEINQFPADVPNKINSENTATEIDLYKVKIRSRLAITTAIFLLCLEVFLCIKSIQLMSKFDAILKQYTETHDIGVIILYGVMSFSVILAIVTIAIGMLNIYSTRKKKRSDNDLIKIINHLIKAK